MKSHSWLRMSGIAMIRPGEGADLHVQHEGFAALGVNQAAARRQHLLQRQHDEAEDAIDEDEGDDAADDQREDAVDQPFAELVEMVEERHLRPGVFEDVGVGELDVRIVVVRRSCAGEGHERHDPGLDLAGLAGDAVLVGAT